jgi:hypothetical protein
MASSAPTYANFKEAYCAVHRCKPADFVPHVLNRSVPLLFRPLAAVTYRFNPRLFSAEVDVIESMGRSSSSREVSLAISELDGLRRVERSFWRGIGLRAGGDRLIAMWDRVKSLVAKPAVPTYIEQPILAAAPPGTPSIQREIPSVVVRKVRQVQQEIISGRPLGEVLAAAGLNEEEFLGLLASHSAGNPGLAWLRGQLLLGRRVAELEGENARLSKTVTAQSVELNQRRSASAPD